MRGDGTSTTSRTRWSRSSSIGTRTCSATSRSPAPTRCSSTGRSSRRRRPAAARPSTRTSPRRCRRSRAPRRCSGGRRGGGFRGGAGWGFWWQSTERALGKLHEEVDELDEAMADLGRAEDELGDVLLAAVAVARQLGLDAESAWRRATTRFADRAERTLALATERGIDPEALGEDELLALYREAKQAPAGPR